MLPALVLLVTAPTGYLDRTPSGGQDASFAFTESRRKESKHQAVGFGSQSESASGGNWTMRCDFPIAPQSPTGFGPETPVVIEAGAFKYSGALKDDPHFAVGRQAADLLVTADNPSGKSKRVIATLHVKWSANRATISFSGGYGMIVGDDYTSYGTGPVDGMTKAHAAIGSYSKDFDLKFKGKVKKITVGDDVEGGEVVTVDLKGQSKTD